LCQGCFLGCSGILWDVQGVFCVRKGSGCTFRLDVRAFCGKGVHLGVVHGVFSGRVGLLGVA
jgi:hypothetical protein